MIRKTSSLSASRVVLLAILAIAACAGLVFLGVLVTTWVSSEELTRELAAQPEVPDAGSALTALRVAMALSASASLPAILALVRLLEIVATVRERDPFVAGNALRLRTIAWSFLAFQSLTIASVWIRGVWVSPGEHVDWAAAVPGWAGVLFLFVLAQVFEHGTRLRDDLEGTV